MSRFVYVPLPEGFERWSRVAKAVWFGLCSFCAWEQDGTGRCWPSQARLGERVGFEVKSIKRGVEELVRFGVLTRERGALGQNFRYVLRPGCDIMSQGCDTMSNGCDTMSQGYDTMSPPDTTLCRTNNTSITIPENRAPAENLKARQALALFDGVWEQFRRYNPSGRADARRAFRRLFREGLSLSRARRLEAELIGRLNEQAPAWEENLSRGEARFNPAMAAWLRREFGRDGEEARR